MADDGVGAGTGHAVVEMAGEPRRRYETLCMWLLWPSSATQPATPKSHSERQAVEDARVCDTTSPGAASADSLVRRSPRRATLVRSRTDKSASPALRYA
jgi:hypothetical protein